MTMIWHFLDIHKLNYSDQDASTMHGARWNPNFEFRTYVRVIQDRIIQWLDVNCKGRWFVVYDRKFDQPEDFIIHDRDRSAYHYLDCEGKEIPHELQLKLFGTREIAFELKSDLLLFKLTW